MHVRTENRVDIIGRNQLSLQLMEAETGIFLSVWNCAVSEIASCFLPFLLSGLCSSSRQHIITHNSSTCEHQRRAGKYPRCSAWFLSSFFAKETGSWFRIAAVWSERDLLRLFSLTHLLQTLFHEIQSLMGSFVPALLMWIKHSFKQSGGTRPFILGSAGLMEPKYVSVPSLRIVIVGWNEERMLLIF